MALRAEKLVLFDLSEFNLYSIDLELAALAKHINSQVQIIACLGSIQDARRVDEILGKYQPQTIFHAAAYKHVPLVEANAAEGVRNNVFGTRTLALAAQEHMVNDFVLISTDKAVRPPNIMGASKRVAEMVLQDLAMHNGPTRFSMVRFGNVLGSSGSVVPLFRRQIAEGGPITVTHPDVTRYFMTIPEAAQLVIQAGAMAEGGEVFVLDMGDPVRIIDLARRMVELSGLRVRDEASTEGDIEIKVIGLRAAEKLYEELLIGDAPEQTSHPRIMKARDKVPDGDTLGSGIKSIEEAIHSRDVDALRRAVAALVPSIELSAAQ